MPEKQSLSGWPPYIILAIVIRKLTTLEKTCNIMLDHIYTNLYKKLKTYFHKITFTYLIVEVQ